MVAALSGCAAGLSPTTAVEQTVDGITAPDIDSGDVVIDISVDQQAVEPVAAGQWPSQQGGYVFSTEPQTGAEQWIFDTYPQLWADGVRALSTEVTTLDTENNEVPARLVQYYNGTKYEGTTESPLGLNMAGQDPEKWDSSMSDASARGERVPDKWGLGYYVVSIASKTGNITLSNNRSEDREIPVRYTIRVAYRGADGNIDGPYNGDGTTKFDSVQDALGFLKKNGVKTKDGRKLAVGEIGAVMAYAASDPGSFTFINPNTWQAY
ncbi:hypothetical protein [Demequina rhizosphaerae]|uniref:hypothetical protein n=1 Tax=Demequina rhizosphaerae TaxID=1638985 RepID=UPI0012E09C65|nr:hypothetical protein [Demequina rhizosphaerae]